MTAALVLSFVAISLFGTSQANTDDQNESLGNQTNLSLDVAPNDTQNQTLAKGNTQAIEDESEGQTRPFIGIVIDSLTDEKAEALGIDSGVYISRVVDDSPAEDQLFKGDIITAVSGESVAKASDLIEIVKSSEPGSTLTFSVLRKDETIEVNVTVGERKVIVKRMIANSTFHGGLMNAFSGGFDSFVRGEVVVEDDGEFKTIRAISGTVEEGSVNEDAGTFVLLPRDGSDAIEYQISDETMVVIKHDGDIGGLNSDDKTIVVDVKNGDDKFEVMVVAQGNIINQAGRFLGSGFSDSGNHTFGFKGRFPGGLLGDSESFEFHGLPGLDERFHGFDGHKFDFDFSSPEDLDEWLEGLPFDHDDLEEFEFNIERRILEDS